MSEVCESRWGGDAGAMQGGAEPAAHGGGRRSPLARKLEHKLWNWNSTSCTQLGAHACVCLCERPIRSRMDAWPCTGAAVNDRRRTRRRARPRLPFSVSRTHMQTPVLDAKVGGVHGNAGVLPAREQRGQANGEIIAQRRMCSCNARCLTIMDDAYQRLHW